MSYSRPLLPNSLEAGENLSDYDTNYGRACKLSSGKIVKCSVAGEPGLGPITEVCNSSTSPYGPVTYEGRGQAKALLGGPVTEGDPLTTDANGAYVTAGPGQHIHGKALESGVATQLITMDCNGPGNSLAPVPVQFRVIFATADNADTFRFVPGFAGKIVSLQGSVMVATSETTGKTNVLNPAIGTVGATGTDVTGGVLTVDVDVTAADPDTLGKRIAATAITGANTFTAVQEITVKAANTTPLTSGELLCTLMLQPLG